MRPGKRSGVPWDLSADPQGAGQQHALGKGNWRPQHWQGLGEHGSYTPVALGCQDCVRNWGCCGAEEGEAWRSSITCLRPGSVVVDC
jgi:hypothetical protein